MLDVGVFKFFPGLVSSLSGLAVAILALSWPCIGFMLTFLASHIVVLLFRPNKEKRSIDF